MAKLEELTELLVSEIRDFEEAVKRLEEIRKAKIGFDVTELKDLFLNHEQALNKQTLPVQDVEKQFHKLLKEAKVYLSTAKSSPQCGDKNKKPYLAFEA